MRKQKHTVLKRIFAFTLAAAMAVGSNFSVPGTAGTVEAATTYSGTNIESQNRDYTGQGKTTKSYISQTDDGKIMVVQAVYDGTSAYPSQNAATKIVVEYYDKNYSLENQKVISMPVGFGLFGGFHESPSNYYVVVGMDSSMSVNPSINQCWQIVQYDKSWNKVKSVNVGGGNTLTPFEQSELSFAEYEDYLIIRTGHYMLTKTSGNKVYDQGSATILLNMKTMSVAEYDMEKSDQESGCIMNSLEQRVRMDGVHIVSAELTNQDPRGVVLVKYNTDVSTGKFKPTTGNECDIIPAFKIPDMADYTIVNTSLGGLEVTDSAYLVAGNSSLKVMEGGTSVGSTVMTRNVFISVVDKTTKQASIKWLTEYPKDSNANMYNSASTPHLVKLPDDNYMVLWSMVDKSTKKNAVYYQKIDAAGTKLGSLGHIDGDLSDCVPTVIDNKLVWYTWKSGSKVFYEIDLSTQDATAIPTGDVLVSSVKLPAGISLAPNGTYKLEPVILPENATNKTLRWETEDSKIATVKDGLVTAVGEGSVLISATATDGSNVKGMCLVTVQDATIKVTKVTLNPTSLTLDPGQTGKIQAQFTPTDATIQSLEWKSNNDAVATVNQNGMVTAVAPGKTKILAMTTDGSGITVGCDVTVNNTTISVTDVKLDKPALTLDFGGVATLTATVSPTNATNKAVTWQSSDKDVASVDAGKVTAVGPGTADITVTTVDGGKTDVCKVTVYKQYDIPAVPTAEEVTDESITITKQEGCQYSIDSVTWQDSNEFTGLTPATEYTVYVKKPGSGYYKDSDASSVKIKTKDRLATDIQLDRSEITINEGDSNVIKFEVTFTPEDVTNKTLKWTSSDESVATVADDGTVTVKGAGTTKIEAATQDGSNLTAACTITVKVKITPVENVTLDKKAIKLTIGETESDTLKAEVTPDDATNPNLVWEISPAGVAEVDAETGTVTAVGAGKATITVSAEENPDIKAECTVEVYDKYKTPKAPEAANITTTTIKLKPMAGCEYSKDGETWQTSTEFTGLNPKTTYTFYARMAENGYYKASDSSAGTEITTNAVAVDGVSLNLNAKKYEELAIGKTETFTLTATVTPKDAENKNVTWTTSNSEVATVKDGTVTVKGPGKAVITVITADGEFKDTCTVEVYQKYPAPNAPTMRSVTDTSITLNVMVGCEYSIDGTTWQDSNVFTGLTADTEYTFYTKRSQNGYYLDSDKSAGTTIRTAKPPIAVTGVTLNETTKHIVLENGGGIAFSLTATVTPADATNKNLKWSSSNTAIATVSKSGTVMVKDTGTVVITVETEDGGYKATCTLTIERKIPTTPSDPTPSDPTPSGPSISDPTPTPAYVPNINVTYRTHVQSFGWQDWKQNGQMAGTSGLAKRLESINISVASAESAHKANLGVQYTTHVQSYGWMPWSANGDASGTEGEAKRLEAIKIQLTGADKDKYDIYYRVHAQSYGWLGWAKNGAPAGTAGYAKRLEGIQIVVVKKDQGFDRNMGGISSAYQQPYVALAGTSPVVGGGLTSSLNPQIGGTDAPNVTYRTHVQSYGWQGWKFNGQMSGTSGQAKRLEGIEIRLTNQPYPGDILYTTHVQSYGWQGDVKNPLTWRRNGTMAGTSGQAKRLEAICITLTGEMAEHYDIYYRVHAQSFGWLGWAKNGDPAGTAGYAKRLEGINIVLVPKGGSAPGSTVRSFVQK